VTDKHSLEKEEDISKKGEDLKQYREIGDGTVYLTENRLIHKNKSGDLIQLRNEDITVLNKIVTDVEYVLDRGGTLEVRWETKTGKNKLTFYDMDKIDEFKKAVEDNI
jgi:hypothetical protein